MRGHVRKRGRGWVYVLDDGRGENGKRRQRWSRQCSTKRGAEAELRKALGRADVGDDPIPPRITVAAHAVRWFAHMGAQDAPRLKVRRGYEQSVRAHVLPVIGNLEVRKVKPAHVQTVLDRFSESHSPRTVARLRGVVSAMFSKAVAWDLCPTNPVSATSTPTASKLALRVPEPDEVRAIVDAASDTPYAVPVLLAATTGARRSEVLGLTWSAVDLDVGAVKIERTLQRVSDRLVLDETTKSVHGRRVIPLTADVVARLRAHKSDQARRRLALGAEWTDLDLVCDRGDGQPVDPDLFSVNFKRIARSVDVPCRLHDLRHAAATRLMRSGLHPVEVAEVMGHASPSFTANVYQHADRESIERTRAAIEGAFGNTQSL